MKNTAQKNTLLPTQPVSQHAEAKHVWQYDDHPYGRTFSLSPNTDLDRVGEPLSSPFNILVEVSLPGWIYTDISISCFSTSNSSKLMSPAPSNSSSIAWSSRLGCARRSPRPRRMGLLSSMPVISWSETASSGIVVNLPAPEKERDWRRS